MKPTERFSSRVENYIKFRPGYPVTVLDLLRAECGLTSSSFIADIGSGTGMLSELFLKNGNRVFAVEPNREMREAAERLLCHYSNFHSIDGAAEAPTLASRSVDFITAGQAFHWFDRERARREFLRVLKPGGRVVLAWNDRNTTASPFLAAYERLLLAHATDYEAVNHKHIDAGIVRAFFDPGECRLATFANQQVFDFQGLQGRLLSSSYAPEAGHPRHDAMIAELKTVFDRHQADGKVTFEYDTTVYYGQLSEQTLLRRKD